MNKRLVGVGAVVVVLAALVAGGAGAASRYLITSTHQISPKVRSQLRSAEGVATKDVVVKTGTPQTVCVPEGNVSTTCGETIGTARCPAGSVALSGGWSFSTLASDLVVQDNHPTAGDHGWEVGVYASSGTFRPYAVCVRS